MERILIRQNIDAPKATRIVHRASVERSAPPRVALGRDHTGLPAARARVRVHQVSRVAPTASTADRRDSLASMSLARGDCTGDSSNPSVSATDLAQHVTGFQ